MVRLQMLNTTARMFFNRPAECKKLLAHLLKTSIEEDEEDDEEENTAGGNSQDVRDRALLYYRLFHGKIQTAFQARPALFPPPIPPSFPVLARAFLWCLGARMWRVKTSREA